MSKPPASPQPLQYGRPPTRFYGEIGRAFTVAGVKWKGPVIASPDAIYFLKRFRLHASAAAGGVIGGLICGPVGHGIALAIASAVEKPDKVITCTYFQLPEEIRDHPDWPVEQGSDVGVLVVPKEAVDQIRHPRFTNLLKFKWSQTAFVIEYLLFRGRKVKAFLEWAGWKLAW